MTTQLVVLATDLDHVEIHIDSGVQWATRIVIALFLFGIALDTRWEDLRGVARRPLPVVVGVLAQYLVTPALTLVLVRLLDVRGSVALGMLLVACCPAGNLSNLLTHRARADVSLSISLTAVSNAAAMVATPLSLAFWAGLDPKASGLLRSIDLSPGDVLREVVLLIGLPFAAGLIVAWRRPGLAAGLRRFVEPGVLVILLVIVVGGLASQFGVFVTYVGEVAGPIVLQNLMALGVGIAVGLACRLPTRGARAMTFELGLRNTGLAVVLALGFFSHLGGVVLVAALWGMWDSITGLLLATWWRRHPVEHVSPQPPDAGS